MVLARDTVYIIPISYLRQTPKQRDFLLTQSSRITVCMLFYSSEASIRQYLIVISMRITYQLVESYLGQELPTIVLTIQNQKYIINVPESFQRFTREHRFKFPRASNIFFTKIAASSVAGLFGFMLTLFEGGNAWDTKMYVQPQLFDYFEEVRYQMGFKILGYSFADWTGRCRRGFRSMQRVQELLKRKDYPTQFHHLEGYMATELPKAETNDAGLQLKNGNFRDENIEIIPFQTGQSGNTISNFICIPNRLPGKVIVERLNFYKVPKKDINKLLTEGQLVLQDGSTIFAKDVKEEDGDSPNFLIIHTDSLKSLVETLKHETLQNYLQNKNHHTESVIHIVEDSTVLRTEEFNYFLGLFPQPTKHVVFASGYKENDEPPQQFRHFSVVSELAQYFPEVVADIRHNEQKAWEHYLKRCMFLRDAVNSKNVEMYKRCHQFVVAPVKNRGYVKLVADIKKEMEICAEVAHVEQIRKKMVTTTAPWNFKEIDPRVIFLGTGSMKPSTYRNVSAILLEMHPNNSIMLDCGEGTYYQLLNHFGADKVQQALMALKVIFITHIHSDHNLGILNLISQRKKICDANGQPNDLFLIVPYNMAPWIYAYNEFIERLGVKYLFIQTILGETYELSGTVSKDERCYTAPETVEEAQHYSTPKLAYILANYFQHQKETLEQFGSYLQSEGITLFKPVHVIHCPQSFGIVVQHKSGIKVSYSGDTIPCPAFIRQAENSTLMIHEATFGDDMEENAAQNMHSTVGQAIHSALKSKSWRLALTHFSQRYKRAADILEPEQYSTDPRVFNYARDCSIICFDHLQMHLSQCEFMPEVSRFAMELLPADKQ